jgi:hypothetical protein
MSYNYKQMATHIYKQMMLPQYKLMLHITQMYQFYQLFTINSLAARRGRDLQFAPRVERLHSFEPKRWRLGEAASLVDAIGG